MSKNRLEAFSDGVFAIIITIMVLELVPPTGDTLAALAEIKLNFIVYILSYLFTAVFWINHHHLLSGVKQITTKMLWANVLLLFMLSLVPFATNWLAESHLEKGPATFYGLIFLFAGFTYSLLQHEVAKQDENAMFRKEWLKTALTTTMHILGIISCIFLTPTIGFLFYSFTILIWIVPNQTLEKYQNRIDTN